MSKSIPYDDALMILIVVPPLFSKDDSQNEYQNANTPRVESLCRHEGENMWAPRHFYGRFG